MKKSYKERQAEWIKENEIKTGDEVLITRAAEDREDGWGSIWATHMHAAVGSIGKIVDAENDIAGIGVRCEGDGVRWYFPYFVLEKINEEEYKKMTDGERYVKLQAKWVKANNLKPGDEVKILRKAGNCESGWSNIWAEEMDSCVGKILEVRKITEGSVVLYTEDGSDWWQYPYFILEKVMKNKDKEWTISYGLKVKTGDPVLVRDGEDEKWRYALFSDVLSGDNDGFRYRTCGLSYHRCIPYVGNEHLVGTKMDYKAPEEPTKPKFIFGAKVKATLSCGDEMEGVLIGFDEEDDDTPFEVAVRDEDAERGRIRYWAKSVTYID